MVGDGKRHPEFEPIAHLPSRTGRSALLATVRAANTGLGAGLRSVPELVASIVARNASARPLAPRPGASRATSWNWRIARPFPGGQQALAPDEESAHRQAQMVRGDPRRHAQVCEGAHMAVQKADLILALIDPAEVAAGVHQAPAWVPPILDLEEPTPHGPTNRPVRRSLVRKMCEATRSGVRLASTASCRSWGSP